MNDFESKMPREAGWEGSYEMDDIPEDGTIEDAVKKPQKMLDAVSRLEIVKNLRSAAGLDNEGLERKHFLEYRESHPSPYGVTLGIEIEIPDESVLPKEAKRWAEHEKKWFLNERSAEYAKTVDLGVPTDTDQFWEFAQEPARNPTTLARETQALIAMGLIDPKYRKFPLHVTVGGITSLEFGDENNADLLARSLDATGWSTDGKRLLAPYESSDSDWTLHGAVSGLLERWQNSVSVEEGKTVPPAVEFRTSQFQNLSGLERYLRSIYYLGSALKAYQSKNNKDHVSKDLAKAWKRFAGRCEDLFDQAGLKDPHQIWKLDTLNRDEPSPFKKLAKTLDKAGMDPESPEAFFVHEMRSLIISSRAEIKEIMERAGK